MLFASRRFIEIAPEELRVATSGAKRIELGVKVATALSHLIGVSREIYAEHPQINPFLDREKATAEWPMQRKHPRKRRPQSRT